MNRYALNALAVTLVCLAASAVSAEDKPCFESRKGASEVTPHKLPNGVPSVKCSPTTGAVLWWGDPYDGTMPMGEMSPPGDYSKGQAVVKPREDKLGLLPVCGVACHNGSFPPPPKDKYPRPLAMHQDIVPDALKLQHGRGAIWCLDCHHPTQRNKLIDNFGDSIGFNEPQKLCGKCHGPILRDWRDGIHGKRTGEWASDGKKRWYVCTECHNPHDVQQGARNSGFAQIEPEPAPALPKGLKNADHERHKDHGTPHAGTPLLERLTSWLQHLRKRGATGTGRDASTLQ
ncbi:MAG: hypothetical protein A3G25_21055 [Betaproteobacteria bacterium RIFCSPLOWO2_12_FULL_63_13]|nr:MAG: hypothetical protein A3G25_21055 [Betaproteobacteria bacterium RIFCSPLOWO2_12_FULL_63_13]